MDVYEKFDKATANISAYALIYAGKNAGRIVLKHGASLTAYVQIWGVEMQVGRAGGGGYDRQTAAIQGACIKLEMIKSADITDPAARTALWAFLRAFDGSDGRRWTNRLETCGFTICTVIGG